MTTFKHRKVQKKRKYGLYALLVGLIAAAILALSVFLLFHIQKIEVTGIEMLTQQEVSDWVKSDTMSGNSLYVLWKSKFQSGRISFYDEKCRDQYEESVDDQSKD